MGIGDLKFRGLIVNKPLSKVTGPEFLGALKAAGWKEGTGTHFFKALRKDGPTRGIRTLGDLERELARGRTVKAPDGKMLHWICNGRAYVVFNPSSKTLITISQGVEKKPTAAKPPAK